MSNSTLSETEKPLFRKAKPNLVFKIFFDPDTRRCLHKTTGDNVRDLPFIEVDYATYSKVEVCSMYRVNNGQLEKDSLNILYKKLSKVDDGIYRTTKNNMIFIVNSDTADNYTDCWDFTKDDN